MASSDVTDLFKTHANYVRAFALLISPGTHGNPRAMAAVANAFTGLPPRSCATPITDGAINSLANAWRTELLLDLTATALADDEFAKLANTWAVIQVYYIFYHCTQALAQALGFPRPESHSKTQNMFRDFWKSHNSAAPWTLAVGHDGPRGLAPGIEMDDRISVWSTCNRDSCWSLGAKALRTTREKAVAEAIDKKREEGQRTLTRTWREEEERRARAGKRPRKPRKMAKPRLSAEEKSAIDRRIRPYTVMDYLYRLRIRTNYADSAMFTDGPEMPGDSQEVLAKLRRLGSCTLLLHELCVGELLGRDTLFEHVDSFLGSTAPPGISVSLRDRRVLLQDTAR
jgi:hypothetical protein